jgi:hypothetical protein
MTSNLTGDGLLGISNVVRETDLDRGRLGLLAARDAAEC